MTANPEGPHFSLVWFIVIALAVLASLPLDLVGWPHWSYVATGISLFAMGMFVGGETGAGDTASGTDGTMTHFVYLKIAQNWRRVLVGVWLSALIGWRINPWLGSVFMLWLPLHYSGTGPGFMDRFFTWLGHRFGRNIRTY